MTTQKNQSNVLKNGESYITTEKLRGVWGIGRMTEEEAREFFKNHKPLPIPLNPANP
jgi:hypothetical protein